MSVGGEGTASCSGVVRTAMVSPPPRPPEGAATGLGTDTNIGTGTGTGTGATGGGGDRSGLAWPPVGVSIGGMGEGKRSHLLGRSLGLSRVGLSLLSAAGLSLGGALLEDCLSLLRLWLWLLLRLW